MALLSIVIAIGWNLFTLGQKSWETFQIRQEAEAAVRLASQVISNEVNYASFLEIRELADNWAESEIEAEDRIILLNDTGDTIILREYSDSGHQDYIIAHTEKSTLEVSFAKPDNPSSSGDYLDNVLDYTITARYKDRDGVDENGDGVVEKAVIYSTDSSIMVSNLLPDFGVPVSSESLYSQTDNCIPGDRILYRTSFDRYDPSAPGGGFTCGL